LAGVKFLKPRLADDPCATCDRAEPTIQER